MKYIRSGPLAVIGFVIMMPFTLFAAPHEPSPAGGGWLELNPELPLVRTEKPWFPNYPGPLTIEAWVYIDKSPSVQGVISLAAGSRAAFSIVGQTGRFTCAIVGDGYKASPAVATRGVVGGSAKI